MCLVGRGNSRLVKATIVFLLVVSCDAADQKPGFLCLPETRFFEKTGFLKCKVRVAHPTTLAKWPSVRCAAAHPTTIKYVIIVINKQVVKLAIL
jgi:hypothetical protein